MREGKEFPASALDRVEQFYQKRAWTLAGRFTDESERNEKQRHVAGQRSLRKSMISGQRQALLELRRKRLIGDDVVHKIEHELDIEEAEFKA